MTIRHASFLALLLTPAVSAASLAGDGEATPPLPRGERLLGELSCTVCHAAAPAVEARLATPAAPSLEDAGDRLAPSYVRGFLADPFAVKPGNRMPHVLATVPEERREAVTEALVHHVMSLGERADIGPEGVTLAALERGRKIFHERGCVACHLPQEEDWELELGYLEVLEERAAAAEEAAPGDEPGDEIVEEDAYIPPGTLPHPEIDLVAAWLASKNRLEGLAAFLLDPVSVRASGRMPALLEDAQEARDVATYLLRDRLDLDASEWAQGIAYEYFEENLAGRGLDWSDLVAVETGTAAGFDIGARRRNDHFGFRFSGSIDVPADGTWTFHTTSDDGSHLWIDGEHVVDNGGTHAPQRRSGSIELGAGRHAIVVTMFEGAGGESLKVEWEGPGVETGPIPTEALAHLAPALRALDADFRVDADLAREGAQHFEELGCAACHAVDGNGPARARVGLAAATPLAELGASEGMVEELRGCLAAAPDGATPAFAFEREGDRSALWLALADLDALAAPLDPKTAVTHALDRMHCYACHRRDGLGGVHPLARPYFVANEDAELGDEGRFPPRLTQVGAKLRPGALEAALVRGEGARPYLAARMPRFGEDNVAALLDLLPAADPPAPEPERIRDPEFLQLGHVLTGTDGLGCIQCHTFGGRRSLGVQAVDLTTMTERIRYGWYLQLMLDPISLEMNTRMPIFWIDGKSQVDLMDRDPEAQARAVWAYLSQGGAMALPKGLVGPETAYELVPDDEPIVAGVFMRDVSPRTLAVGNPELVHYAFDMESPRLARIWRGRFFNTRGTWEGRAGRLEQPASDDRLDPPAGPTFARLADPAEEWPEEDTAQWRGRAFDAERRPILRYDVAGVSVQETPRPNLADGEAALVREFVVRAKSTTRGLWMRVHGWSEGGADWRAPEMDEAGWWRYDFAEPNLVLRVRGAGPPVHVVGQGVDVLLPVQLSPAPGGGFEARFEVEVSW